MPYLEWYVVQTNLAVSIGLPAEVEINSPVFRTLCDADRVVYQPRQMIGQLGQARDLNPALFQVLLRYASVFSVTTRLFVTTRFTACGL